MDLCFGKSFQKRMCIKQYLDTELLELKLQRTAKKIGLHTKGFFYNISITNYVNPLFRDIIKGFKQEVSQSNFHFRKI